MNALGGFNSTTLDPTRIQIALNLPNFILQLEYEIGDIIFEVG